LISQISCKYQQLHVQSKEVVSKWQGIVDDHRLYEEKFFETVAWITSLEDILESLLKFKDQSETGGTTIIGVQNLMAEKEQASHRLGSLTSAGERLFPETASAGREKIRQDLKLLRIRWEELERRLSEQHKSQEQKLQRLSTYQDGIVQISVWLDTMEKCIANDQSGLQAASLPEIRSHLLKQKTFLQDVLTHKRQVEALKERARSLVEDLPSSAVGQPKESQDVQRTIDDITNRYEILTNGLQGSILNSEWLLDVLQQHHDLEKAQSDWQQQAWLQLNSNTGIK
jgi:nesprin-1